MTTILKVMALTSLLKLNSSIPISPRFSPQFFLKKTLPIGHPSMSFLFFIPMSFSMSITSYIVSIDVHKIGHCKIFESISVNFPSPRHGLFRTLPFKSNPSRFPSSYSNISVLNHPFHLESRSDSLVVKIGDPTTFVEGDQHYDLIYSLSSLIHHDRYALNLIGFEWENTIKNVTFSVKYPFPISDSNFSLFSGKVNSFSNFLDCKYDIFNSTVFGHCSKLPPRHGITISLYIADYKETLSLFAILPVGYVIFSFFLMLILFFMAIIFVCTRSTKDPGIVAQIDLHPAEVAELLCGRIRVRETIVRLMDCGCISMNADRTITKIKYPEESPIDQIFVNELRQLGKEIPETTLNDFLPGLAKLLHRKAIESLMQRELIPTKTMDSFYVMIKIVISLMSMGCVFLIWANWFLVFLLIIWDFIISGLLNNQKWWRVLLLLHGKLLAFGTGICWVMLDVMFTSLDNEWNRLYRGLFCFLVGVHMIHREFVILWTIEGTQIAREVIAYEGQRKENVTEDMENQYVDQENGMNRAELNDWIYEEREWIFVSESNGDGGGSGGDGGGGGGDGGGGGGGGDW